MLNKGMPNLNRVYVYFGLILFLIGIFNFSITPVFEGFDENAHFSSIRQVFYYKEIPLKDNSYIDQSIEDYKGPQAYSSGNPPYDSFRTYKNFFSNEYLYSNYESNYRADAFSSNFYPSLIKNWESQHPPLYYLLMAPALTMLSNHSLVPQIFFLRLISYSLALLGIFFGMLAVLRRASLGIESTKDSLAMIVGFIIYPLALPMFFPEFSRIGNDSLCLFLVGLLAYFLGKTKLDEINKIDSISIGIILGLGLLTKALFIPIAGAIALYFLLNVIQKFKRGDHDLLIKTTLLFSVALFIGSSWYLYNFMTTGNFIGSNISTQLSQQGGFWANIFNTFNFVTFIRGLATTLVTFIWGGTWSLAHLPYFLYLPSIALILWLLFAFFLNLSSSNISSLRWMPIWLIVLFEIGFLWHVLVNLALGQDGNANTPGWYLHILLPFLAPAIGLAAVDILKYSRYKVIFFGLITYSLFFYLIVNWFQISLFSGCSAKGVDKSYLFNSNSLCFDHAVQIYKHLQLLAYPNLAIISLFGSLALGCLLFVELKKYTGILVHNEKNT